MPHGPTPDFQDNHLEQGSQVREESCNPADRPVHGPSDVFHGRTADLPVVVDEGLNEVVTATVAATEPFIGIPSSVWRLRSDAWEFLGYATKQLAAADAPEASVNGLPREIRRLLQLLEAIEMYWAFPGHRHVTQLRQRIDAGDYRRALELIEPVTRGFARLSPGAEERESSAREGYPRCRAAGRAGPGGGSAEIRGPHRR